MLIRSGEPKEGWATGEEKEEAKWLWTGEGRADMGRGRRGGMPWLGPPSPPGEARLKWPGKREEGRGEGRSPRCGLSMDKRGRKIVQSIRW
jgi:hypothetical protein